MNFLDHYATFASNNEAPPEYHKWAALSVLSSIISRRVYIDQGIFTIYPNLYLIFVGPPGNGKSTAMNIAKKMVREFKEVVIAPASITKESITQLMGQPESPCKKSFILDGKPTDYCALSFYANELVTLLGAAPIPMIAFFTDIYDEEVFEVATKNKGCDLIERPCINLLGCMTPEITTSLLKQNIISGGFNRRCIFVNSANRGEPNPRPIITEAQKSAWSACIAHCTSLLTTSGKFHWTPEAEAFFDHWYITEKHPKVRANTDIVTQGYFVTRDVMLLKISMLISLATSNELVLTDSHLKLGLSMLTSTEHNLSRVFDGTGRNELSVIKNRLLTMLETSHPLPIRRKQIDAALYEIGTAQEIQQVIDHLISTDKIRHALDDRQANVIHLIKQ